MRKFLITLFIVMALAAGSFYLVFYRGFYLDLRRSAPLDIPFCTDGSDIMLRLKNGEYEPFEIRGVDLLSIKPGSHFSDFALEEEDYLRYLAGIWNMGANTVRVYTVMDDDFYRALHAFNTNGGPIYLIQGIQVDDSANYGEKDAYSEDFLGALLERGVMAVDVIHGRRYRTSAQMPGGGNYFKDVSPWVLGYMIGSEWAADTVAYTDNSPARSGEYRGEYFYTAPGATPFEAMLARVMERIMDYESSKYKVQRLIGFITAPDMDFLTYEPTYARQLYKYAWLDPENVLPTDKVRSGRFAAYRMFDFAKDFSQYLSHGESIPFLDMLDNIHIQRSYGGYLDLLGQYHTMPVFIAAETSTARSPIKHGEKPLSETEQGWRLMQIYRDCKRGGLSGMCISAWQDNWGSRSWNTAFAIRPASNHLWHDLLSSRQNIGLMDFEPGKYAACVLDGDISEWAGDKPVLEGDGISLFLRSDREGLYLLAKGEAVSPEQALFLPMDISEEVGSFYCADPPLEFERPSEFLLVIDGRENTRLLVHKRYDATRMNFGFEQGGTDPFIDVPEEGSGDFYTVTMAVENPLLIDLTVPIPATELRQLKALKNWESGSLTHGSQDTASADYSSLADFCFGNGCVELHIPWLLLNISDPAEMLCHRDYYDVYGVEHGSAAQIWLGAGDGGAISMSQARLAPLGMQVDYRERLKDSYYIVQQSWAGAAVEER